MILSMLMKDYAPILVFNQNSSRYAAESEGYSSNAAITRFVYQLRESNFGEAVLLPAATPVEIKNGLLSNSRTK
jgi:hypothetical protein